MLPGNCILYCLEGSEYSFLGEEGLQPRSGGQRQCYSPKAFVFELAEPAVGAPSTSSPRSPPHEDRWPDLIEKMEAKIAMVARLTGMVSQMEATMLQRFRTSEDKLTQLQQNCTGAVQPAFQAAFQGADDWDWHWPNQKTYLDQRNLLFLKYRCHYHPSNLQLWQMCLTEVLVESSSAMHITIPQDDVDSCLITCKSRRNLAGRLATRLFTKEERCGSNTRGMCRKKVLNLSKVKAIYS